ncbi:MAG: hypothetical protein RBS43_02090 [Candidatus Cloacimonas sp.]|jgi:ABC-type taurine transport system ATPase subunit|nr:hypothetical protein [Candidatus Cloacimonas sp.]
MLTIDYFILDAAHPLITADKLQDELILYNLDAASYGVLQTEFLRITGKEIDKHSFTTALSGGQRIILMALLALLSPAPKLKFINLMHALDSTRRRYLQELLDTSTKEIILENKPC